MSQPAKEEPKVIATPKANEKALTPTPDNMRIWNEGNSMTDPRYTAPMPLGGGRDLTSINAYYLFRKATKVWGPYGEGWFLQVNNHKIETIQVGDKAIPYLFFECTFHYPVEPQGPVTQTGLLYNHFQIFNEKPLVKIDKNGKEVAERDFYKKLYTNTISKALSYLGFGADVFMHQFDDEDYVEFSAGQSEDIYKVEERKAKKAAEDAATRAAAVADLFSAGNAAVLAGILTKDARKLYDKQVPSMTIDEIKSRTEKILSALAQKAAATKENKQEKT